MKDNGSIFGHLDYRLFLKDFYESEKKRTSRFSYRYFAKQAGLKTSSFLKMVIDGKRGLTTATIASFGRVLKLSKKEQDFFEALVFYNQARTQNEREHYYDRLVSLRPQKKMSRLKEDQYEYYSKPYMVAIREMTALPDFDPDPAWIAKNLVPPIRPSEARHALDVLLRLKLIQKKGGKIVQSESAVATESEVDSMAIFNYHRCMLDSAGAALMKVDEKMRDITSLTIPIPLTKIPKLKKEIEAFREHLAAMIDDGDANYHEVYQFNIQLFPVTNTKKSYG